MNKLTLFFCVCFCYVSAVAQNLKVGQLTCEYRKNPIGIDAVKPLLSWKISSSKHNVSQKAYQILVSDDLNQLNKGIGNVWDSKKVSSSQSIQNLYLGLSLKSAKIYFWKVKVWDNLGNVAASEVNKWQMGLLKSIDWSGAKWIAYEKLADSNINVLPTDGKKDTFKGNNVLPMFRKPFEVRKAIKNATIFISGLGHYELSCNGVKVGDDFLAPGWTKYDKEAQYVTYDITKQLKQGSNVLGVMLGNGFYYVPPVSGRFRKLKSAFGYPKMICKLSFTYTDGTISTVISDQSWKTSPSAVTFSSIYGGEDYNANLEEKGWNEVGFQDANWKNSILVSGPRLIAQSQEPIKVFDEFKPIKSTTLNNQETVYDFGQNASAIIEIKVKGKKGDSIKITPAELLKEDGSVSQKNSGSPFYFTYVLKGDGVETWRPRFTYYGFRYAQVKGKVEEIKSIHIRNSANTIGSFKTSNQLFNQTFELINWATKSNMMSVLTDCPHREKLGWLEQVHLMGSSIRYNFDVAPLFKKSLADMRQSQLANGLIPEIAPEYVKFDWGDGMFRDSPEWGSSAVIMPWYLYQWYGDKSAMTEYYPMMKRYLDYLGTVAKNHLLVQGLGDWYDLGPKLPGVSQLTPMGVTGTAIYYYDLTIMHQVATLLGKKEDAVRFKQLAEMVKEAFNGKFFNRETKQYATGSQTANAMAVYFNLVNPEDKDVVIANLIKDIQSRGNALTAGDIGYRYVLRVLEDAGRSDVIFDMNSRSDVPGYGMQLAKGATALTESWAGLTTVSNNHLMLGHLMEWFYSGLGGIRQDESALAFKKIKIYPELAGDINHAETSYDSPYGKIVSNWRKEGQDMKFEIVIPTNTTATVYLPVSDRARITEAKGNQFQYLGTENGRSKVLVGSGSYEFKIN